ncbi:hypothetical protein TNCV_4455051 [Trichonephila clavipes]|nr:hypothetical protein TNCV_4455051 [Trichonephila clavipes]
MWGLRQPPRCTPPRIGPGSCALFLNFPTTSLKPRQFKRVSASRHGGYPVQLGLETAIRQCWPQVRELSSKSKRNAL